MNTTETKMMVTYNEKAKKAFNRNYRKEGKCYFESFNAIIQKTNYEGSKRLSPVVELRLYGSDTTWYAALWVHSEKLHTSGTGKAGGYGYHKPSAAASEAIRNAGFELSKDISGVGDGAIEDAILGIAEYIGHSEALIFKAHQ